MRLTLALLVLPAVLLVGSGLASAGGPSNPDVCQRAVLKGTSRYLRASLQALQRCERRRAKGEHEDPCPCSECDPGTIGRRTHERMEAAASKLRAGIDRRCGGPNGLCEIQGDDDLDYAALFGVTACPDLASHGCAQVIAANSCTGLRECAVCTGRAAVDHFVPFLYGNLEPSVFGARISSSRTVNRCQQAIGAELVTFALAKDRALVDCWDGRLKGKHSAACPDLGADPVTGREALKAARKIARAEFKKISRLCRACGGGDKACDDLVTPVNPGTPALGDSQGGDDIMLTNVFETPPQCPNVTAPARADRGAIDCGESNPIETFADLVFCLDCVAEFHVDCLDSVRVPDDLGPFAATATVCNPIVPGVMQIIDATGDGFGNALAGARAVASDTAGNVYVGAQGTNNVFRITPGGVTTEIIDATGDGLGNVLDFPFDVVVDGAGSVYVAGAGSHNVFRITTSGVISEIIDSTGDGVGGSLFGPRSLAVDAVGNLYIAGSLSHNAFKVTPAGVITEIIDSAGDGLGHGVNFTRGIDVDASRNVYVTGSDSHNAFKISAAGAISQIIDATGDGVGHSLGNARSIRVAASGNVYVEGRGTNNVFKITPGGVVSQIIDATGDGAGNMLDDPHGLVLDANENVYIAGNFSNNAFRVTSAGNITEIINAAGDGLAHPLAGTKDLAVGGSGVLYVAGHFSNNAFKIVLP